MNSILKADARTEDIDGQILLKTYYNKQYCAQINNKQYAIFSVRLLNVKTMSSVYPILAQ